MLLILTFNLFSLYTNLKNFGVIFELN